MWQVVWSVCFFALPLYSFGGICLPFSHSDGLSFLLKYTHSFAAVAFEKLQLVLSAQSEEGCFVPPSEPPLEYCIRKERRLLLLLALSIAFVIFHATNRLRTVTADGDTEKWKVLLRTEKFIGCCLLQRSPFPAEGRVPNRHSLRLCDWDSLKRWHEMQQDAKREGEKERAKVREKLLEANKCNFKIFLQIHSVWLV